jgi:demethylmacrocin O-methyltransferase
MADLLTKLCSQYKCDKSDRNHKYTPLYHTRLNEHRHEKFHMLEFGYGVGKSVKMWLDYFTSANLVSVDIRDVPDFKHPRFEYVQSDQIDIQTMSRVIVNYHEFFLIIDDASHVPEDQQFTLGYMFPFVESGGWYVIEDLKCKRNHSDRLPQCKKTIPVLQKYIDTAGLFDSPALNEHQKMYLRDHIKSIKIYNKIAFIRKR